MATINNNLFYSQVIQELISGDPFEITNSFQQLGGVINCKGMSSLLLYLEIDVNSSTDIQLAAKASDTEAFTKSYDFPIRDVSASVVDIQNEVNEFEDSDNLLVLEIVLNKMVPYLKFYVKDAADGTGQIDSAKIKYGK